MAIEVMQLVNFDDNTDEIVRTDRFLGNDAKEINFLPNANLVVVVSPDGRQAGVLFQNPENTEVERFANAECMECEDVTGATIVVIRSGEELFISSLLDNKEIWVVNEPSSSTVPTEIPQILIGA